MSGATGQQFGVRLSVEGAEAVEAGLRRVQNAATQATQTVERAGESSGRALVVIERGADAASKGLTKLGGDFAALAPIVDNAGGAVGRIVSSLGSGAGLVGTLGAVGAALGVAIALYQNWDKVSRATATAIDFLTGRVRVNVGAINDANAALRAYLQLSESAAQAGNRRFIQDQRQAADAARGRLPELDRSVTAAEQALEAARVGITPAQREAFRTGRGAGNGPLSAEQIAENERQLAEMARRRENDFATQQRVRAAESTLEQARAARRGQQVIIDRAEGAIAGAVADQGNPNPGRPQDAPAVPAARGGGGGGRSAAASVNDALRDREALIQRNITAEERYAQGMARIADLNDRLIAQGNDPLPDEQVQREATRLMEEYERATRRAGDATRDATDSTKEWERAANGAAKALSGAFEDLVFEGRDFNDVLKDLERNLLRIGNQTLLQPLFQQGLNWLTGGGGGAGASGGGGAAGGFAGLLGSIFGGGGGAGATAAGALEIAGSGLAKTMIMHEGGVVGLHGRPGPPIGAEIFAAAPRFHMGGMIGPDERPIIAQVGERVLNRREAAEYARGGGRGGSVTININGVKDPNEFRQSQSQIAASMARALGRSGRNR